MRAARVEHVVDEHDRGAVDAAGGHRGRLRRAHRVPAAGRRGTSSRRARRPGRRSAAIRPMIAAMRSASTTPRVGMPRITSRSAPRFDSRISWAMRVSARSMSACCSTVRTAMRTPFSASRDGLKGCLPTQPTSRGRRSPRGPGVPSGPAGGPAPRTGDDHGRERHRGGSLAVDDGTGHVVLHDVPRRGGGPAGARLRRRVDDAEVPPVGDRRPRSLAARAGRLGAGRGGRRAEGGGRGHGRGVGPVGGRTRSAAGTGCARATAGGSGCTCRRCSRSSASSSSRTTRATTACARSEPAHP